MVEFSATTEGLLEVVGRMLAEGAFIAADPIPDPIPFVGVRVRIGFDGPQRGAFFVDASPALGAEIAANLGVDDAVAGPVEALRELTNMIAGAALPRMFGSTHVFSLGIPGEAVPVDETSDSLDSQCQVSLVSDEGHHICVRLCLGDGPRVGGGES